MRISNSSNIASSKNDNIPKAVAAIVFAVVSLSLGDAVIKAISVSFPLWQLYVLRSAIVLSVLIVLVKFGLFSSEHDRSDYIPTAFWWALVRSLLLGAMWVVYYISLPHLELSVAAAAYYTLPLFITLLSALFVGERVGAVGWFAILFGFAGVLVMLRPDVNGINIYTLLPVLAALFYAVAMILTRTKCQAESPMALSIIQNVTFIGIGLVAIAILQLLDLSPHEIDMNTFVLTSWSNLGQLELLALCLLALVMLIGNIFTAYAYQSAPSSTVSTFDYSYLVASIVWSVVFFSQVPDLQTTIGIGMITIAGIIAVRR